MIPGYSRDTISFNILILHTQRCRTASLHEQQRAGMAARRIGLLGRKAGVGHGVMERLCAPCKFKMLSVSVVHKMVELQFFFNGALAYFRCAMEKRMAAIDAGGLHKSGTPPIANLSTRSSAAIVLWVRALGELGVRLASEVRPMLERLSTACFWRFNWLQLVLGRAQGD
eukprot:6177961-Pleurochrysis_carterae.AAC.2